MKQKSRVFNEFKKWQAIAENEINLKIKCFRYDDGREYNNKEFVDYYADHGIRMVKNGIIKRMNRTLHEREK